MNTPTDPGQNSRKRLDSWKEIAAYLNRDRRTVQRREANEGLPARRHVHESLATVFAYTSEWDAWLANRQTSPAEVSVSEAPFGRRRFWAMAGIGLGVTIALAAASSQYF